VALTPEHVLERINSHFPGMVQHSELPYGLLSLIIERERLPDFVYWLKQDDELQFSFLTTLCGMHYPDAKGLELGVVYHLHSLVHNFRLRIKLFFPMEDPIVPSLTGIFSAANWLERETFDFYGIKFAGHPNLTRILNVEDMDYHPMLKHYPLEDQTRHDKDDTMFGR